MGLSEVVQMGAGVCFVAALPFLMSWVEENLMSGPGRRRD